jgi:hypothetical protein
MTNHLHRSFFNNLHAYLSYLLKTFGSVKNGNDSLDLIVVLIHWRPFYDLRLMPL